MARIRKETLQDVLLCVRARCSIMQHTPVDRAFDEREIKKSTKGNVCDRGRLAIELFGGAD